MLHYIIKGATGLSLLFASCLMAQSTMPNQSLPWQNLEKGSYTYNGWADKVLEIAFTVPKGSDAETPVLLVIPGAKRNVRDYRDHWHELALEIGFIVLSIGCDRHNCPGEYQYNLGGLLDENGTEQPQGKQFFSAPELVFNDFVKRFGSNQKYFAIYGHSAGGGFVHLYMLARPNAPVSHAVSANAAFFTMPDLTEAYPFGLKLTSVKMDEIKAWMQQPLTFLLADQDLAPRTKALSNSEQAQKQGLNVFARGLSFYARSVNWATEHEASLIWKLDIVHGVGHDSGAVTPRALPYLFPQFQEQ
ncbi:alpha/beta hydrolase [Aliiglaciecola sp. CAU 1673]|uniref:alpha/beta hydrolase n=1 Tax=Aliiglaciecola sp. CAU 1673 TaxID=3032595 RepID=UPI0023DA8F35|nr:alpha/beta hydrolase [Aliiglaciecola sp. CAU 1673]MDF2177951.1 alpha/beta hydrolase [Aliiglaciecola sp. CAU 1673]